jgi:acid phosphatase family membrane protein YuiD
MMSLTVAVGLAEGWGSPLFAVTAAVAMVVMYDAAGIRRAAGKQAATLNRIIDRLTKGSPHMRKQISPEELREILGHTPIQVLTGAALGIAIALLMVSF